MSAIPFDEAIGRLAAALPEPMTVVDAGCRWGFADAWLRLGDRTQLIGFDPDAEECERLQKLYADRPSVHVVPKGLGAETGPATLYVTKLPQGSSLYPPAAGAVDHHPEIEGGRLDHTETVELTTFDDWAVEGGVDHVDLIKLDTQGSELDILRGGERALAGLRAVECEVEFNELYGGISLFGDIDRYLRERGFLLWQFRNLVHYSRAESRLDFRVPTTWYHDSTHVVELDAKAGQLFWADAFFVQRDVADPRPELGWAALARDACLTSSLRFYDLTQMALDAALEVAPPSPAEHVRVALEALEATLDAERRARIEQEAKLSGGPAAPVVAAPPVRAWQLERDSVPLVGTHVVHVGHEIEGTGWGPPQGGGAWRWTGPGHEAAIDLALQVPPGTHVELFVVAAMRPAILDQLVLEVNGLPVPLERRDCPDGWAFGGFVPASYSPARRFTRVLLRTIETVPAHPPVPGNPVTQGVGVARLTLTAPGGR